MRERPAGFVRAEIRGPAGEIIVHAGEANASIDCRRAGSELEIEVRGLVERAWIGSRSGDPYKHIVVDQDAMRVLSSRLAEFLQRLESSSLAFGGLELRLLLHAQLAGFARKAGAKRARRRTPFEGKL